MLDFRGFWTFCNTWQIIFNIQYKFKNYEKVYFSVRTYAFLIRM